MFVSSYSTYISTNSTDRAQKEKEVSASKNAYSRFSSLQKQENQNLSESSQLSKVQLPINYVSNYKVMNNQQKLQEESQSKQVEKTKYTKISTLESAKNAYTENTTLFASLMKPKITLNQTPSLDTRFTGDALKAEENILKHKMLNTYIANDNYYKITA